MKNFLGFVSFILCFEAYGITTLKDAFKSAKLNMESLKRADIQIKQSEELKNQAKGAILPTLSIVGSYTMIDPPNNAGQSPFLLTKQHTAAIRVQQPLMRGGSFAAYQFSKENILLSKFQKDATEINLYRLVVSSYYGLIAAKKDVQNVQELLNYSNERFKEISSRAKIGRSRRGELVEAQAQLHIAESQYQQSKIALNAAEKNFEFYTNLKPDSLEESTFPIVSIKSLEIYLSKSNSRPDLLASEQNTRLADEKIKIARGAHLPQVDITSNFYLNRTGILATSEWDIGVSVSIPLYQGGVAQSSVREALHVKRMAQLQNNENFRIARREIEVMYQNLILQTEQIKSLKEALKKSEEAYRLNNKDYQFGLVTNLDVLQSMNMFVETKRNYDRLVSSAQLNLKDLEALSGVIP